MQFISVLAAAAGAFVFGAVWYMSLAKPWVKAANIELDENGRPANDSAKPYIISALMLILVAGMMRHIFSMAGIEGVGKGFISGLGIGLFMAAPWIVTNHAYGDKPLNLTLIDGGYATFGSAVIGLILALF